MQHNSYYNKEYPTASCGVFFVLIEISNFKVGLNFPLIPAILFSMIHYNSRFKTGWDLIVLGVALYAALSIPLSIVFPARGPVFYISSWIIAVVFIFDILINFNTTIRSQGKIITDLRVAALKYVRGWFWLDLAAAMPFGLLVHGLTPPYTALLDFLRLNHLLKLLRSRQALSRFGSTRINPAIFRLFMLVFWIFLAAHFISCGWIFISGSPGRLDPSSQYIEAFYWTITTLTTIGYGDITPSGNVQIVFVVFIELLGAGMYGLIIGNIANLIANIDVAKTQYKEKIEKINTFLKYRSIPHSLQIKINDYYTYLWESRKGYDESDVLDDLPMALKVSVSLFLNREIIEKVPIFEKANDDLIKEIIMNLKPVVFTPGDDIVKAGEMGFDMYFISKGSVDVLSADEKTCYAVLMAGQFFGEMALLLSTPRTATIKAREYCDLYRLDKETFDRVLSRHPEFADNIQKLAQKRKAENEALLAKTALQEEPEAASGWVARERREEAVQKTKAQGSQKEPAHLSPEIYDLSVARFGGSVKLSWSRIENLKRFEIIKKNNQTGKWIYLSRKLSESAYTDTRYLSGRLNTYRVRAITVSGAGPWSRSISID